MQAIAQFAADERYRPMLPEVGALPGLQALLSSHLPHVQQCALSAIANTSFVPAAAAPLCATGVLAHLGQLLFSAEEATQTMCLTALSNLLGASPQSSDALVQVGGHMALLTLLSSPSAETQSQAPNPNPIPIPIPSPVPILSPSPSPTLTLTPNPSPSPSPNQAAMLVGHMCRNAPVLQALMAARVVPLLTHLIYSPIEAVQLQVTLTLTLAPNPNPILTVTQS